MGLGRGAGRSYVEGYDRWCLRTSGGIFGRAIEGHGHQATALTDVRGSMAFINMLTGHGQKVIHFVVDISPKT